jgi:Domain of unknown function (DUF4082)
MRSRYWAVCAALFALAACDGESVNPVSPATPEAPPAQAVSATAAPTWTIFTTQQPTEFLDATSGWEVSTRFHSSKRGKIVGFRFYRAPGETGYNYGKLWTDSGQRLKMSKAFPSGTGWVEIRLDTPVEISENTNYRVSVNTNTRQAKKGGAFAFDGAISNGPLYASGSHYGQPINAMPTSGSASMFFVDVIFEEYVPPPPQPNLYVNRLQTLLTYNGQEIVLVRVCNAGNADAPATYTRLQWYIAPLPSGWGWVQRDQAYLTRALAANGDCQDLTIPTPTTSIRPACHQFAAWADFDFRVPESAENDNLTQVSTCLWS